MSRVVPLALGSLLAWLLLAATPAGGCACGIAIDAEISEERALVIERPGREEIVLSLDLTSEGAGRAAVVLPVPGDPRVEAIRGGDPLDYLDRATAPPPDTSDDGEGDGAGAPAPVDVIGRDVVGGYDVSRLRAGDPGALDAWLDANGYELPPGAEPILGDYVDRGWRYVAIRLAPRSEGRLRPLRVSFDAKRPVYPMRLAQLGEEQLSLTLYTLAAGERRVEGLDTVWSGPVADLGAPPPPSLRRLFASGEHVTRMEAESAEPSQFSEDLAIEAGASGALPGEGPQRPEDEGLSDLAIMLLCAAALALAATVGLAIVRRRRR